MSETLVPLIAPTEGIEPASPAADWWQRELRPLLQRVHFYAGLFVAPFLLVAAVTGLLYTLTPQLEELVHHDQLRVTVPPGAAQLPLDRQVGVAIAALPAGTVTEIRPPRSPDGTTRVIFNAPGVRPDYSRTVFVDPYTGHLRGVLTTFGEWLPVRAWFDEMHRTLHLGSVGEVYSELAASWLWVLTISGLAMWLTRRRRARRQLLLPRRAGSGRVRLVSWHGAIGLWVSVGLLFLSATGLTWSQFAGANVTAARHAFTWSTPSVHTALPGQITPSKGPAYPPGPGGANALAADAGRALDVARAHGLTDPVALNPPTKSGQGWTVHQVQRSWPEKQDAMAIDPATGTVLDQVRFADWPLAAKLARWGVDAHMTLLFGLANQIALAVVAIGLITMIVIGYRMWWLRRPSVPGTRQLDDGQPPGGVRRPGFTTVALAGALAVGIGLALPVFGASLLAFLLLDRLRWS